MNLQKLFEMQAKLDEHIMQQHPELRGQNNLDWKLLALQVELGECVRQKQNQPRKAVEWLLTYMELYKRVDKDKLIVVGMFTAEEVRYLRYEGYKLVQQNKNGIRVEGYRATG
ncbi:dUTP diphosphatase [Metasolibacillus meyeri]|uniref:dUTP diphosphatase n=1 Tax=Metasolibacillus meyeri TaxID=1071052 RepID=UPI000D316B2B|nr:dUTP diphosphatase [Metasolibacillus meyeri]